jgi:hypothetical protein
MARVIAGMAGISRMSGFVASLGCHGITNRSGTGSLSRRHRWQTRRWNQKNRWGRGVDDWITDYTINGEHWVRLGPYEPQKYDYETSGWVKVDGRRLELHAAANTLIAITDDRRAWVLDLTMRYEWNPASGEIREV